MTERSTTGHPERSEPDEIENGRIRSIRAPETLTSLRQKLGRKAKQEPKERFAVHLRRRSQRRYRLPHGVTLYRHLRDKGLRAL